jgi:glutamate racemase
MKIGIFDSGSGGITVLHEAVKQLPQADYIFYADTDHVPYGRKTADEVIRYTTDAVQFLADKGVQAVVLACNTATAVAVRTLREQFTIPIIGIEPAVKPAVQAQNHRRVMVIATPVTVREEKLNHLIRLVDNEHEVDRLALPQLVEFAEREEFDSPQVEAYLRGQFDSYDLTQYSHLVLGCTHFGYFRPILGRIFPPQTSIIDGNAGTVRQLKRMLGQDADVTLPPGSITYYQSGKKVTNEAQLQKFERLHAYLEQIG